MMINIKNKNLIFLLLGLVLIFISVIFIKEYNLKKDSNGIFSVSNNKVSSGISSDIILSTSTESKIVSESDKIIVKASNTNMITKTLETPILKVSNVKKEIQNKLEIKPSIILPKATITQNVIIKNTAQELCDQVSGGFVGQVESEINSIRLSYGLSKLIVCKELRNSSYQKYLDIIAQNNFTHDWANGKTLYNVIVNAGYTPKKWGEILEYGSDFTTAKDHVDNWMSSPAHKSIILSPEYTHFGVYVGGWNVEDTSVDMGIAHFGKK